MALTPLEVIAQRLQEKRESDLESILSISGSAAIAKNEYGITVVDDTNIASSLVFKPLTKDKLDEEELLKAIDINVKELKPDIPVQRKDLVPKSLYDEQIINNQDLSKQVKDLTAEVETLTNQVTDLKAQIQTEINNKLVIEQTNDVLSNQMDTLNGTITDFTGQISTSLQKSVDESILRASLQSQNTGFQAQIKALIKQIDSLNSIIEGLQSQLGAVQQQQAIQQGTQAQAMAAGAVVINDVCIVKVDKSTTNAQYPEDFYGRFHANAKDCKWINGKSIDFTNNDTQPITITVTTAATQGVQFMYPAESTFTIAAGAQKTLEMKLNAPATANVDSKSSGKSYSHSALYKGGSLTVSVKRNDGSEKNKSYTACFDKNHPDSY